MMIRICISVIFTILTPLVAQAADEAKAPGTVAALWADFDPRQEDLNVKVWREWEKDGIVYRYVTFHIGTFHGKPATMAAFFGFPKGAKNLPSLLHLHGGGQRAFLHEVEFYAKRGYACLSINWGGREMENAKVGDPNTDWGAVDPTQKNVPGYFNLKPGEKYLDPFESPRNNNWYWLTLGARRGLTFLEQQPEVDADRLGVYGHSMGGNLTVYVAGTRDGILRHASYAGLREDKPPEDVKLDVAIPVEKAIRKAGVKKTDSTNLEGQNLSRKKKSTQPVPIAVDDQSEFDTTSETFVGVRLTHPDKVLYPEDGITKLELASYYRSIAPWILPHVKHRPLVLVRCPDGLGKESFYQKHPGIGTPDTFRQISIHESTKTENYVLIDDVNGLISLAQISALEVHAWGSQEDKLERPDRLIFDLDPSPEVSWARVIESAKEIRTFLQDLGLASFVKTTGGKGLHLVVPIERRHDWDEAKGFCKGVADAIVAVAPQHYTSNMSKAARTNKIFLDYLRNGRGSNDSVVLL